MFLPRSGRANDEVIGRVNLKPAAILEAKGTLRGLLTENDDEEEDAKALFKALSGGEKPAKGSTAMKYMKAVKAGESYGAMARTKGASTILIDEHISEYLRVDGARLLVVVDKPSEIGAKGSKLNTKVYCGEMWKLP